MLRPPCRGARARRPEPAAGPRSRSRDAPKPLPNNSKSVCRGWNRCY